MAQKIQWLEDVVRKRFPTESAGEIAADIGVAATTISRRAKSLGLEHDAETIKRLKAKASSKLIRGWFPTKEQREHLSIVQKKLCKSESYRASVGLKQRTKRHMRIVPRRTIKVMCRLRSVYNYFYDTVDDMTLFYDSETRRHKNEKYFADKYHLEFKQADD